MSFSIICDECKSINCTIDTVYNGEFIEIRIICDDCGHKVPEDN